GWDLDWRAGERRGAFGKNNGPHGPGTPRRVEMGVLPRSFPGPAVDKNRRPSVRYFGSRAPRNPPAGFPVPQPYPEKLWPRQAVGFPHEIFRSRLVLSQILR